MRFRQSHCDYPGCPNKHYYSGYCAKHAQRKRRYGDPSKVTLEATRVKRQRASLMKSVKAKKTSYLKYYGRHEHRVVAERMLGRTISSKEIVHHIDGDKHNNHESNLLIMSQSEHIKVHLVESKKLSN